MSFRVDAKGRRLRALGLCSGGLDSLLALSLIRAQGVEVTALTFVSPFVGDDQARAGAEGLGLPLRRVDFTEEQVEAVRKPRFGRGSNMNPCLDCHALMFRLADRIRRQEGYHFIFSGEVLGQRPMSQNRPALGLVAQESGAGEYLVRPLSARRLEISLPEEMGWLDREALLGLSGRGRKPQMRLARVFGLRSYPSPAGGCLLTDPGFSRRLGHLLSVRPQATAREMNLLKWGRHFDLGGGVRLILGRNQADNEGLAGLIQAGDLGLNAVGLPGPLGLIPAEAPPDEGQLDLAGRILLAYTRAQGPLGRVEVSSERGRFNLELEKGDREAFRERLVI